MTHEPTIELSAAELNGSHLGKTATLAFGTERHPRGLLRGTLESVKHAAASDDVEVTLAIGGQRIPIDVHKDKVVQVE